MAETTMAAVIKIRVEHLSFHYGAHRILDEVSALFPEGSLSAITGPSGQGKSTFLTCLNRLWEEFPDARAQGDIWVRLDGRDRLVSAPDFAVTELRRRVAMVFQTPNPLPMSILKNLAFPLRLVGIKNIEIVQETTQRALIDAFLWDEVKDRLHHDARTLSGGQQQRLCIARAIATSPEVLLMDEPCSALDPIATAQVEELIDELRSQFSVVIVTHSMQQAARVSQRTAFFHLGNLVEYGETGQIFTTPRDPRTESYITGRIG